MPVNKKKAKEVTFESDEELKKGKNSRKEIKQEKIEKAKLNTKKSIEKKIKKEKQTKTQKKKNDNKKKKNEKKTKPKKFVLSEEDKRKLKEFISHYNCYTVNHLKLILKKNNQKVSGNKKEIVERISDGRLFGAIPNCPECFTGKLRFNNKTGVYSCPGYMDDTKFHHCGFKSHDIIRKIWIE